MSTATSLSTHTDQWYLSLFPSVLSACVDFKAWFLWRYTGPVPRLVSVLLLCRLELLLCSALLSLCQCHCASLWPPLGWQLIFISPSQAARMRPDLYFWSGQWLVFHQAESITTSGSDWRNMGKEAEGESTGRPLSPLPPLWHHLFVSVGRPTLWHHQVFWERGAPTSLMSALFRFSFGSVVSEKTFCESLLCPAY